MGKTYPVYSADLFNRGKPEVCLKRICAEVQHHQESRASLFYWML